VQFFFARWLICRFEVNVQPSSRVYLFLAEPIRVLVCASELFVRSLLLLLGFKALNAVGKIC